MTRSTLLTPDEIADLTDIKTGKGGKSREERQLDALRKMKIPYFVSAIGRPKVSRAVIDGGKSSPIPEDTWEPALGRHA